jgi:tetratricopeptide repeat protein
MAQVKTLAAAIGLLLALPAATFAAQAPLAPVLPAQVPGVQAPGAREALEMQALDVQARSRMGSGDFRSALRLMREHVAAHPDDRAARLDLVRYYTWSGDFAAADTTLHADPQAAESDEGRQLQAGLLAWAGRIDAALAANAPLLAADPDSFLANYIQAVALRQTTQPRLALAPVAVVKRVKPGSGDAIDLERGTWIHTASFVSFAYDHASDSQDLAGAHPTLRAEIAQGDALRYTAEFGRWDARAPQGSPFAALDGSSIAQTRGLFGLRYASSPRTSWSTAVGYSSQDGDGNVLWRAGVDARASDDWRLGLMLDHDRLDSSARSLSLDITRTDAMGTIHWTPDLRWTGDLVLHRDHYSDGNNSTEFDLSMRRAVVRHTGLMLDVGAMVQHIGYDDDPGNGYYAPDDYRRYGLTANAYVALGENTGLSLQAGLGRQRDETFTSWRRANDASAAIVFGIFSPWQLTLHAAYSERVQTSGAYEGRSWGLDLTRRF